MAKSGWNILWTTIATAAALVHGTTAAERLEATATIKFTGDSTLHGFEGTVATQPFAVEINEDAVTGKLRLSATTAVRVPDMTTHHGKRDKNMFKMLDLENFTLISGALTDAAVPQDGSGEALLRLKIRDVEQEIVATLSDWKRGDGQASCRMAFPVSLKAFGLKAPSVAGLIRVGDTVMVECMLKGTEQ